MKKLIFILIFIATFWVRLTAVSGNNFPFTTDQGRDLIDMREMVVNLKPRLIGPTTSINGVYLGPFWYYFNLPAFLVSGGDPASLLAWQIVSYQIVGFLIYWLVSKSDEKLGFFASIFYLIMPVGFNTSRYFWNANAMPIFTALFLLIGWLVRQKATLRRTFLLGLVAGLSFQIEAAFGVLFFPFSFLYLLVITRKIKVHLAHLVGFGITLLPQAFFELRHQFPMVNVFVSEISGRSNLLGEKLTLSERVADRITAFSRALQESSHLPTQYLFPLFFVSIAIALFLLPKKKTARPVSDFFFTNLAFVISAFVFYLIFRQPLKVWYLLGLSTPLVFIYVSGLRVFPKVASIVLIVSLFYTFTAQKEYLSVSQAMGTANKSSLKNELLVLDWVYQKAQGKGFKVYSYLPSVYDYPYQYLFWWYGKTKYGYLPSDAAYLPNQPEYIAARQKYLTPTRELPESEPTFLIIEEERDNPQFQQAWLGNFAKLCQVDETVFSFGTIVRKLEKCSR